MNKWAIFSLFFCLLVIAVLFSNSALAAFTEPTAMPPDNNTEGYLNIGDNNQIKRGSLRFGTPDSSPPYDYQLEVLGQGAVINDTIADNDFKVSETSDTLYVDSKHNRVCIGPCLDVAGSKLEVSGRGVYINNGNLFAASADQEAVYGQGTNFGIYGIASGLNNYGVWAQNTSGTALEGENINNTYSSVIGYSDTGYGIYGINTNVFSQWSGYFAGRAESSEDVIGAKFLPTTLQSSLVPYTAGQVVATYSLANAEVKTFDGTYIWVADATKLYKIRASDMFKVLEVDTVDIVYDVIYDGNYVWYSAEGFVMNKIDPNTGALICSVDFTLDESQPHEIVFDGQNYWATGDYGAGWKLMQISSSCGRVNDTNLTNSSYTLGTLIYNGSFLWVLATHDTTGQGFIINVNPSNRICSTDSSKCTVDADCGGGTCQNSSVRWDGIISDLPGGMYFDNFNYWVTGSYDNTITRHFLLDDKYCSIEQSGALVACQTDSECSAAGLGGCFAKPQYFDVTSTGLQPSMIAFDGIYLWVGSDGAPGVYRILAADPTQQELTGIDEAPTGIVFDGTYIWVSTASGLYKVYSGSNYGDTNLKEILTLQSNSPLVSQQGNFSISGSAKIGLDMSIEGDFDSLNNVWGTPVSGDITYFEDNISWEFSGDIPGPSGASYVYSLLAASDGTIFAGNDKGNIFKSTDYGANWTQTTDPAGATAIFSLLEASDGTIFAGTWPNGGIYTYNPGDPGSWTLMVNLPTASNVRSLIQHSDGTIFAGTGDTNGDVYKYTTAGGWVNTGNLSVGGEDATHVYDLAISNGVLYAGTSSPTVDPDGKVYKYDSALDTWANTGPLNDGASAGVVYSLLAASDGTLYAGTGSLGDVYKSVDGGANWTNTGDLTSAASVWELMEANRGSIYAGTGGQGNVYKYYPATNSWLNTGNITDSGVDATYVFALTEMQQGLVHYPLAGTFSGARIFKGTYGPLLPGVYNCPDGHFITNITRDADDKVILVECRPL